MPIGYIIGGALGLGSAIIGSSSASDAANAQVQAANTASQTQLQMFNQTQQNEAPFLQGGIAAYGNLLQGLGISPPQTSGYAYGGIPSGIGVGGGAFAGSQLGASNNGTYGSLLAPFTQQQFQASPGYQYQLQQGNQAIQNSAAARGGLVSGNALMALQQNGQGLANQDWYNAMNSYYARQNQLFNMLDTVAGSGQNAAANLGALGSQTASQIGNNTIGAGNATAAAALASGQLYGNALNGLATNSNFINGISNLFNNGGGNPYGIAAGDGSGIY